MIWIGLFEVLRLSCWLMNISFRLSESPDLQTLFEGPMIVSSLGREDVSSRVRSLSPLTPGTKYSCTIVLAPGSSRMTSVGPFTLLKDAAEGLLASSRALASPRPVPRDLAEMILAVLPGRELIGSASELVGSPTCT